MYYGISKILPYLILKTLRTLQQYLKNERIIKFKEEDLPESAKMPLLACLVEHRLYSHLTKPIPDWWWRCQPSKCAHTDVSLQARRSNSLQISLVIKIHSKFCWLSIIICAGNSSAAICIVIDIIADTFFHLMTKSAFFAQFKIQSD